MKLPLRTIRMQLTLWFAAALTVIILIFAGSIYLFVRTNLEHDMEERLEQQITAVERVLREDPGELPELEEYGTLPLFRVARAGTTIFQSTAWQQVNLNRALPKTPAKQVWMWETPKDVHFYLQSANPSIGPVRYKITAAQEAEALAGSLKSLRLVLLVGLPCALIFTLGGGYFLAGQVLQPVGQMAAKARDITADRLSERLPIDNPDDEFGQLARIFNQTLDRLERAFDNLRRFTADASHELRTPLTALRSVGEVGLQKKDRKPAFYREVIASMLEETDRLARLVEQLLTLSRADRGQLPVQREEVALHELIENVVGDYRVLAEEKHQRLILAADQPIRIVTAPALLRQAAANLLENAIKYTPEEGTIRVETSRSSAQVVTIAIHDNGPGISKEHQKHIFDRFYRVDEDRSSQSGGTGLGLAIAQRNVELSGGWIQSESIPQKGSTFSICFPQDPTSSR